eukprot:g9073.t1
MPLKHPDGCLCCRSFSSTQQSVDELEFAKSACSAAKAGDCVRLKSLLARCPTALHHDGVDGKSGYTPLHYAARAGRLDAVLVLLKLGTGQLSWVWFLESWVVGADVNKQTNAGGATSLHRAAFMGHSSIVEALMSRGANGSIQDSDGETPAHKAFSQNHIQLGELLLDRFPQSGTLVDRFGRVARDLIKNKDS